MSIVTASQPVPVLSIRNLNVDFPSGDGVFYAVNNVSLDISRGEVLGVIGESGAGKSMTGSAVTGLIDRPGRISAGQIHFNGTRIDNLPEKKLAQLRGRNIGTVFQDPLVSLNPLYTIGRQLIETICTHIPLDKYAARQRAIDLLTEVGIADAEHRLNAYPHQFSGGMRQRVVIALAIATDPELLIADEPTSALDVSVQAQIIALLKKLATERGLAVLLITHDMGVIAEIADRVIVMNRGQIVESGFVTDIIRKPQNDYTRALIEATPSIKGKKRKPEPVVNAKIFIRVENLHCDFRLSGSRLSFLGLGGNPKILRAVNDVSFSIEVGRTFALVGESGSGKSTIARIIAGLTSPAAGRVLIGEQNAAQNTVKDRRNAVQMIFQDPYASLNPRWRVKDIIAEPVRRLGLERDSQKIDRLVVDLLDKVRLPVEARFRYPHEFSGGQRQRIAIARALAGRPRFIVCDEPTSALDVSVQAQVLDLMADLQAEFGLTYLLISHNLAVVRQMADRVGVLQRGVLVEEGAVDDVFENPAHEYTRMLLAAVVDIDVRCER